MSAEKRPLVAGILAHVDAGKTTLSEALLYRAGALRSLGRVDHGDAFLDTHSLEKERGITIFSKQARFTAGDTEVTLLDTPGHVDFSAEMERTLQVLDLAVLVISGTDGVQSHTRTLWRLCRRYGLPVFLFINKMDLAGADKARVMAELKAKLDEGCADFTAPRDEAFFEALAMADEGILNEVLSTGAAGAASLRAAIAARRVFPCWFGSALRLEGVDAILQALDQLAPRPQYGAAFGAKVYKIGKDPQGGRLTYMKLTGGTLRVKTLLQGVSAAGEPWAEKADQLRLYSGSRFTAADEVKAGSVCAVAGLSGTWPGEGLGAEEDSPTPETEAVFTYTLLLPRGEDPHRALDRLRELEEEAPELRLVWNEPLRRIQLQLMGEVQLEVLKRLIAERCGLDVAFSEGGIAYKESIRYPVEGVGHYGPLRHYAEVHLLLEPGERGSGLHFASTVSEDELDRNWQRLILTHLMEKTHRGVLIGAPITDMKLTLIAGRAHLKHTEGGDFRQATYRAVRQGLRSAESVLLEPWYRFEMELPQENLGRAIADVQTMGGSFEPAQGDGETAVITGRAPVARLRGYQAELTAYTHGLGRLFCAPDGYAPCQNTEEVVAAVGYDADADLENTADSVFCSHGAGVVVKWNEVREHMHIDTGWGRELPDEEDEAAQWQRRAAAYVSQLAGDEELLRIFERTYGPVKKDRLAMRGPRREPSGQGYRAKPLPEGPEYLLVDGYNVIFAWDELRKIAEESLDAAREKLIHLMCNYQGFRRCELILVFDAYKVKGNHGSVERVHNVSVVYTKEAETADMYIERVTKEIGKRHRVRVATSDGLEQLIIIGHGALRVTAAELHDEVKRVEQAIRDYLEKQDNGGFHHAG